LHRIGGVPGGRIIGRMKRRTFPLWLIRDLPALIGIALCFWPLMIMVIIIGRRAMLGKKISRRAYDCIMQMLPMAETKLRFALHRQAWRVLGWNPRACTTGCTWTGPCRPPSRPASRAHTRR
jgi:hypothetical protein